MAKEIIDEVFRKKKRRRKELGITIGNPEIRLEIPRGAMDFITTMTTGFIYHEAIFEGNTITIFSGKIPLEEDIASLCRAEVLPIAVTAQAIRTPFGRVLRFEVRMYDDPEHPYIGEAWANLLDSTQKEGVERLKTQSKTLFLLFDANNARRCTKGVTISPEFGYGLNLAIDAAEEDPAVNFDDAKMWAMSRIRL